MSLVADSRSKSTPKANAMDRTMISNVLRLIFSPGNKKPDTVAGFYGIQKSVKQVVDDYGQT
jgi:hypothetical protein